MLSMATAHEPRFILSDLEIEQGDYRGTYVFLKGLRERFPDINFRLLTGADSYETMPHWRDRLNFYGTEFNGEQLMKEFELIVFARAGSQILDPEEHKSKGYAGMFWLGPKEGFVGRFSSTEIRRSLLKNRGVCPEGLLPEIYQYILKNDLYKA
jgi:nicotinate-nucleotide adenylyltransferase